MKYTASPNMILLGRLSMILAMNLLAIGLSFELLDYKVALIVYCIAFISFIATFFIPETPQEDAWHSASQEKK